MREERNLIFYIRDGKEFLVKFNFWNRKKILEDIFESMSSIYKINDNIEFIYFKNFDFNEIHSIDCFKDTICILDNCYFFTSEIWREIKFKNGIYHVINPKLVSGTKIYCDRCCDFLFQSDVFQKMNKIRCEGIVDKIELKNGVGFNQIDLGANDIYLNGEYHLNACFFVGRNIKIGSLDKKSLIESCIRFSCYDFNEIVLSNCEIDSNSIYMNANNIYGNGFVLKSSNSIHLNGNVYNNKQEQLILTDKDFDVTESNLETRRQLISILKGVYIQKNLWINKQINKESIKLREIETRYELEKEEVKKKIRQLENRCYNQSISKLGK